MDSWGQKWLFPRRGHSFAPLSNLISSVFLHRFCTLGTKKPSGTLPRKDCSRKDPQVRPSGCSPGLWPREPRWEPMVCVHKRNRGVCLWDRELAVPPALREQHVWYIAIYCMLLDFGRFVIQVFLKFKGFPTSKQTMKKFQTFKNNLVSLVFNCWNE